MAIKGKSKSRGAKTVARGPKPVYVPVKVPWYRRRGLWLVVATLVVVAAVEGLVYGFVNQANQNRSKDDIARMATAVNKYKLKIEPILATAGSVTPPSSFTAFPDLGTALSGIEATDPTQDALDQAASAGDTTSKSAADAANKFDDIDATKIVSGQNLSETFVLYVLNSRDGFARGAKLFKQAGLLTSLAAKADPGQTRSDLIAAARSVQALAQDVFATAYSDYIQAEIMAGVYVPTGPLSGLTGATGPATGPATGATGATAPATGATGASGTT